MSAPDIELIFARNGEVLLRTTVPPGEYVIGREAGCDLAVVVEGVSRKHAKLTVNYDNTYLEDLGSSNGTYVAERKISAKTRLFPNQSIRLGTVTLKMKRLKSELESEPFWSTGAVVDRYLPAEFLRERKYDIGAIIAEGGMGTVVEAQEKLMRRKVAMKLMRNSGMQEELVRFIEEAQITGQLEHPNIVPVHELGVDEENHVFYTMKLVRGITLHDVLHRIAHEDPEALETYSLGALLTIFQKVCDALAFAHSKGVIHRDLKPANVMLGEYGEVLVVDWGLARASGRNEAGVGEPVRTLVRSTRQDEGSGMMTSHGMVLGTPQYMPPEQARGETEKFDGRTDIYSLGALLYHMLTLEPPISGDDVDQMLQSVADGKVAPHFATRGSKPIESAKSYRHIPGGKIPDGLATITRRAMAMEQGDRFQSVKELQAAIQVFLSESTASVIARGAAVSEKPAAAAPRQFGVLVVVLCVIIAALGGACTKLLLDRSRLEAAQPTK